MARLHAESEIRVVAIPGLGAVLDGAGRISAAALPSPSAYGASAKALLIARWWEPLHSCRLLCHAVENGELSNGPVGRLAEEACRRGCSVQHPASSTSNPVSPSPICEVNLCRRSIDNLTHPQ